MINLLSFVGLNLQAEVCIWTILGILRTIFDATLFKVNSNLKQVWQMDMPDELSLHVQRVLRTIISGVMLVQCFTLYVYLAAYVVLLYPVFLEERPTLVLPWLLLAAIRGLLCELISLSLGLGSCVVLGPARPACVKFVVTKLSSIAPAFYMWMLVYWYYHSLKMAAPFKTIAVITAEKTDNLLELAIRRRRTKSLKGEEELRKKIIANLYEDNDAVYKSMNSYHLNYNNGARSSTSVEDMRTSLEVYNAIPATSNQGALDASSNEDWPSIDTALPRDTDRILEQFVIMLLKIGIYLERGHHDYSNEQVNNIKLSPSKSDRVEDSSLHSEQVDAPPDVGSCKGTIASYLLDYPKIFMKNPSDNMLSISRIDNINLIQGSDYNRRSKKSALRLKSDSLSNSIVSTQDKQESSSFDSKASKQECSSFESKDKSVNTDVIGNVSDITNVNNDIDFQPIKFTKSITDSVSSNNISIDREMESKMSIENFINSIILEKTLTDIEPTEKLKSNPSESSSRYE